MVPVIYNIRSLKVRWLTTTATALGIALVVFVFAAALMLGEGVERAMGATGSPDTAIVLRQGSDAELSSGINNDLLNMLRERPEVSTAAGGGVIGEVIVVVTAEIKGKDNSLTNVLVRGTPKEGIAFRPEVKIVKGRLPQAGTNEVIVGKSISGRFKGLGLGESFDLRRNRPLKVVGVFSAAGTSFESEVWGDLDVIRTALGRGSVVSSARVRLESPAKFAAYRSAIEADKRLGMKVMHEKDYYEAQSEQTSGFLSGMGIAVAILFSLGAMIGAAITMNGAIAHRTKEIGTLRALGFSRLAILVSFVLEAVFLALLGGAIGLALAMLLGMASFPIMNFATFSEIVIGFRATPSVLLTSLIFSAIMGLIGGLFPAIRAARVSPVEAMRG